MAELRNLICTLIRAVASNFLGRSGEGMRTRKSHKKFQLKKKSSLSDFADWSLGFGCRLFKQYGEKSSHAMALVLI